MQSDGVQHRVVDAGEQLPGDISVPTLSDNELADGVSISEEFCTITRLALVLELTVDQQARPLFAGGA